MEFVIESVYKFVDQLHHTLYTKTQRTHPCNIQLILCVCTGETQRERKRERESERESERERKRERKREKKREKERERERGREGEGERERKREGERERKREHVHNGGNSNERCPKI